MALSHKRELHCPFESPVESLTKRLCCLSLSSKQTDLEKNYCLAKISATNECTDNMDTSSASAEVQSDLFKVTMRHGSDGYQKVSKTLLILDEDPWHEVFEKTFKAWNFCSNCSEYIDWNAEYPYPTVYYHHDSWFHHCICHACMTNGLLHWLRETQSPRGIEDAMNHNWKKAITDFHNFRCEQRAKWWNVSSSSVFWTVNRTWFFFTSHKIFFRHSNF